MTPMKPETLDAQAEGGSMHHLVRQADPPCSAVLCWARHTIMDGKVVTYSTSFEGDGEFPHGKDATGYFEISASRNCVMVHRATIKSGCQLETFKAAIEIANRMHCELSACNGRPEWSQPNDALCRPADSDAGAQNGRSK